MAAASWIGGAGSELGAGEGKTVWFVRHGQAEHNVLYESGDVGGCKALLDPLLTARGRAQAAQVAEDPMLQTALVQDPSDGGVELAVCSPLRRTVQTALGAMRGWAQAVPGRRIVLHADLQETGEVSCDTGLPLEQLRKHFADEEGLLDFGELREGWERKVWPYNDSGEALRLRTARFSAWLCRRPESRIAVITHHNLLAALLGVSFLNCEVRQFTLRPPTSWAPLRPRLSAEDSELSEADLRHLGIYDAMVRRKFRAWGFEPPGRLR